MSTYIVHEFTIEEENDNGTISYIPKDLDNVDYQEYLASLNEVPAK